MKLSVFLTAVVGVLLGTAVVTGKPANRVAVGKKTAVVGDVAYVRGDDVAKRDVTGFPTITVTVYPSACGGAGTTPASAPVTPPTVNTAVTTNVPATPPASNQPVCQIGDGQVQAGSGAECAESTITSTLTSNLVISTPTPAVATVPPQYTPPASASVTVNSPPGVSFTTLSSTLSLGYPSYTTLSYSVSLSTSTLTTSAISSTAAPPAQETGGSGVLSGDLGYLGGAAIVAIFMPVIL